MKKRNVLKNNYDFNRIINNNKPFKYKYLVVYKENIEQKNYHFGLSVGKKIGNAVIRNKYKRILRDIITKMDYQNNFNCIIILSRGVLNNTYEEISNDIKYVFKKINILKEENSEK